MDSREQYEHYDAIVIGGGPAGYTAMIYLAREAINALCVEGFESGGQLIRASRVENFPGFPDGVGGAELPALIKQQAANQGAKFAFDEATAVDLSSDRFIVTGNMNSWTADSVIMATGSKARSLGLESEATYRNKGVAYCAICDGPFFAKKRVAVVGGGDGAVEQVTTLTNLGCEVVLIHRREELRAAAAGIAMVESLDNVEFLSPYVVEEMVGQDGRRLSGLILRNTVNGESRSEAVDACFVSIGHDPASELVRGQVDVDDEGYVLTKPTSSETSREGVFAAGDLIDRRYRQGITAAGSGCAAALDAARWLAMMRGRRNSYIIAADS